MMDMILLDVLQGCRFNQVMGTGGENVLGKHAAHPLSQYQTDLLIKGIMHLVGLINTH